MRAPTLRHDVLAAALHELQAALAPLRRSLAVADDPLRLAALPPPPAGAAAPGREVLAAYAALYLQAELEDAGVLPAAEALAAQRRALVLEDRVSAQRLERFALGAGGSPARAERVTLHARLFGLGPAATRGAPPPPGSRLPAWGADEAVRLDFRQRLLRLATAVARAEAERLRGGRPGLAAQAAWRAAAQDLLALAAAPPAAALVNWARHLHARTLQAFELLGDAGLMRQLGSHSAWDTLQRLLPPEGGAGREAAARRGAAGQALLRSLADAAQAPYPDAPTVQAALRWLAASGLPVPRLPQPPAQAQALPRRGVPAASAARAWPAAAGTWRRDLWAEADA